MNTEIIREAKERATENHAMWRTRFTAFRKAYAGEIRRENRDIWKMAEYLWGNMQYWGRRSIELKELMEE